jgi:hypothetical protein
MKLYISGGITGYEDENRPAFNRAAAFLRGLGHSVINPMDSDGKARSQTWADFLRKDLCLLSDCEGIALLPGWHHSRGARLEVFVAVKLGMFFRDAETGEFMQIDLVREPVFGVNGITELLQWHK